MFYYDVEPMKTLNNMNLQYIDQESVENFINGMVEVDLLRPY